jgi:hydroxymethylpyrimidine/phosphomethylpyrimidine kinase
MPHSLPVVLTVAGFDPSSGAGITADIKTIAAHGCYGIAAITALTVQSTTAVRRVEPADPKLLRESLDALAEDAKIAAVHVGMLGSGEVASLLADFLTQNKLPNVVLDTVLAASSGARLLDEAGIDLLKKKLLPLATLITPNAREAGTLTGTPVESAGDMRGAAEKLAAMGAKAVLVTGGHLDPATDVLRLPDGDTQTFKSERMDSKFTHGTGCALSSSIASYLAQGRPLAEAVLLAKAYVTAAIANGYEVGKGVNPVNHMYRMRNHPGGFAKKFASGRE